MIERNEKHVWIKAAGRIHMCELWIRALLFIHPMALPLVISTFLMGCALNNANEEEKRTRIFLAPGTMGLSLLDLVSNKSDSPILETTNVQKELKCENLFKVNTAPCCPDITWVAGGVISSNKLTCLLKMETKINTATIETDGYLLSDYYKFFGRCSDNEGNRLTVLKYKNTNRPYLFRFHTDIDPYAYVVVGAYPKGSNGTYHYSIAQQTNDYEKVVCHTGQQ